MTLIIEFWDAVKTFYTTLTTSHLAAFGKKLKGNNVESINVIFCGLEKSKFVKVMHCKSEKGMWGKLENVYEGCGKVQKEKL